MVKRAHSLEYFGKSEKQMTPLIRSLPLATEPLSHKWRRSNSNASSVEDELPGFPSHTVLIGHASRCSLPETHEWLDEKVTLENMWVYRPVSVKKFLPSIAGIWRRARKEELGMDDCEWGACEDEAIEIGR